MENIYQPQLAKITAVSQESIDTKMFRFKFADSQLQKRFAFLPGQFLQIGLPGWGECPISICSSPSDAGSFFELAIRGVGNLTKKINTLKIGDEIWVRGPFGNGFDIEKLAGASLVLIGGGCGFVPLRPLIIDSLADGNKNDKLQIFYGCLNESTLLFKKQYSTWNRGAELGVILEKPSKDWAGEKGMITDLIRRREISPKSKVVMVGPPVMYRFVIKELLVKKIKPANIWLSLERKMYCGLGVCQHCAIGPYYVCKDGPVFTYDQLKDLPDAI
ncbi:MAG: FAD/NAD(P)-binding protein [Patescibacteria group bacterium]